MTTLSTLEAYDLIKFSEQFLERLTAAQSSLAQRRGLKAEKDWMATAHELVTAARAPTQGLLERARELPELEEVRDDYVGDFQNSWVDALERLLAGITFHCGSRNPVIEALYPHQKLPLLRRCGFEVAEEFSREFDRRLKGSYVSRQFAQPDFAFILPAVEQVGAAWQKLLSAFGGGEPMAEELAIEIRKELVGAGKRLDLALLQARLLAEAALAPVNGGFEASGLGLKPKKRKPKAAAVSVVEPGSPQEPEAAPAQAGQEAPAAAEAAPEAKAARAPRKKKDKPAEAGA